MSFRLLGGVIFLAMAMPLPAAQASDNKLPNIVYILTDDQGWGDLAAYGHDRVKTPHLDALAREGMLFTQFYAGSPVCSPSRASILSGRFAPETGIHYAIGGPGGAFLNSRPWFDADQTTLYDVFRDAGYTVGHFGKWHLGGKVDAGTAPPPEAYGIDVSATTNSTGAPLRRGAAIVVEDTLGDVDTPNKLPRSDSTQVIVENSIDFIAANKEGPFFVSLWTLEPHSVLDPTPEQMEPYLYYTHPNVVDRLKSSETVYYASLTNIDTQIGKLFDYLEAEGLEDNTIVVFTSDNGPSPLWSLGTGHAGAGQAGPFRGTKGSLYEGGIRVPFIVRWPGQVPADTINVETVLSSIDMMATLTGLAGLNAQLPANDGEDLSAALRTGTGERSSPLFWEYRAGSWGRDIQRSPRLAMRDGDWKLLMNPDGSRVELYNLARYPDETGNVADYETARLEIMTQQLMGWYNSKVPDHDKAMPHTGKKSWRSPPLSVE
ncbi:sulfatase-like hydrolase/transferase [Aquisalinus flavus]|uniref:N-acetylgalactosamine-6-sulfatase n=1 Tax=Aquisalinus flavus TaxID=1526572 RepID=A0A8J2V1S6_9PROT|nr:sulfatase-like hydrolase/transferase [Aquisalinus flavus]MBD0425996.1 sulfatase-like hydrolase/transferase [Aquisalinus flavus]GGD11548.1 N-acetylgalactosamine-6-sulfatase [Aquisalinus flavus]